MLKRLLSLFLLMLVLVACASADDATSDTAEVDDSAEVAEIAPTTEPEPEATEAIVANENPYNYDLDVVIDFPMAFGGTVQMSASSDWRINDESENDSVGRVVLFLDDGFLLELYVSNDPTNDADAPFDLLNGRNGTAEISTIEYEGLTVYTSETFLGNKLGFATLVNDQQVAFIEVSNTRRLDKTLLTSTVLEMLASVEALSGE